MLNFKIHYLSRWGWGVGIGGWSENGIEANSAQLKLELGLSLAINVGFNFSTGLNPILGGNIFKIGRVTRVSINWTI